MTVNHSKLGQTTGVEAEVLRVAEGLASALGARFLGGAERAQRTRAYCEAIGAALGMSANELRSLRIAALVYDIGLLGIPEAILRKEERLNAEEFDRIKSHVTVGAELVAQMGLAPVAEIVLAHHERWNGSGYPDGLKGEDIPLGARILAAVDCFCALARKSSDSAAAAYIGAQAGISFDPRVAAALLESRGRLDSALDRERKPVGIEALERARREAWNLDRLNQELGSSLSATETLATLAREMKGLVPYDGLAIYLDRGGRLALECMVTDAFGRPDPESYPAEGLCRMIAETGRPILNGDPVEERESAAGAGPEAIFRAFLGAPLERSGSMVGVLGLFRREPQSFEPDELRILMEVAPRAATAIDNAVKHQTAMSSATTDYMTGLANSRSLFQRLDDELARCRRTDGSLTVFVCDLDGFKDVNDQFGHLAGNQVLRAAARALELNCREYDFVARMGGDEFVMALPGLPVNAVDFKREQLSRAVEEAVEEVCPDCGVTISVGHAQYAEDGLDAESLLAAADRRMYRAKHRSGRRPAAAGYALGWRGATVN
ncbi:MAG: diguanylate cyclase [Bryobacteraceae bacterium]|nr:diguanylate cyclase [Bryobacteraceae bacterium]